MLVSNWFPINGIDKCIYNKFGNSTWVAIYLYVDDMLIFETSAKVFYETKKFVTSKFDMKDLWEVEVILGIKITKTPNGLFKENILRKFEHFDYKLVLTPNDPNSQLKKDKEHSCLNRVCLNHWEPDVLSELYQTWHCIYNRKVESVHPKS